jgi:hypothetical protein
MSNNSTPNTVGRYVYKGKSATSAATSTASAAAGVSTASAAAGVSAASAAAGVSTASAAAGVSTASAAATPYVPRFALHTQPTKIPLPTSAESLPSSPPDVAIKSTKPVTAAPYIPNCIKSKIDVPIAGAVGAVGADGAVGTTKSSKVLNYSRLLNDSTNVPEQVDVAKTVHMDDFDRYLLTKPCGDVKLVRLSKQMNIMGSKSVPNKNSVRKSVSVNDCHVLAFVGDTIFDNPCDWNWDDYVQLITHRRMEI